MYRHAWSFGKPIVARMERSVIRDRELPHSASLDAGYELRLSSKTPGNSLFPLPVFADNKEHDP
jgi:hypothetical protein